MTLEEIVKKYYEFRGYATPNSPEALLFLVSEVGELADAHVSEEQAWIRNSKKTRSVADEVGDVQMMLVMYCATVGLDPVGAMLDKMRSLGFEVNLTEPMDLLN